VLEAPAKALKKRSCLPRADYLELSRFGMFKSVDRQEILAAIDTEIARPCLGHADKDLAGLPLGYSPTVK
jgi:hypothetical protein